MKGISVMSIPMWICLRVSRKKEVILQRRKEKRKAKLIGQDKLCEYVQAIQVVLHETRRPNYFDDLVSKVVDLPFDAPRDYIAKCLFVESQVSRARNFSTTVFDLGQQIHSLSGFSDEYLWAQAAFTTTRVFLSCVEDIADTDLFGCVDRARERRELQYMNEDFESRT